MIAVKWKLRFQPNCDKCFYSINRLSNKFCKDIHPSSTSSCQSMELCSLQEVGRREDRLSPPPVTNTCELRSIPLSLNAREFISSVLYFIGNLNIMETSPFVSATLE